MHPPPRPPGPDNRQIDLLLAQLGELDAFLAAPAQGNGELRRPEPRSVRPGSSRGSSAARSPAILETRRQRVAWLTTAAAAALLCLAIVPPKSDRGARPSPRGPERVASIAPAPPISLVTHVDTCADEDSFLVVLTRSWNNDCQCLTWRLHEFGHGVALARLMAGQELELAVELAVGATGEQFVVLALARDADDLPDEPEEGDILLECLNDADASATLDHAAQTVASCLPSSVTVVPRACLPR